MALLTKEAEAKIATLLVAEGLADANVVGAVSAEMANSDQSTLGELVKRGAISEDMVSHATALLIGVPYVELRNVTIDQDILALIPQEAQTRVLAIPLGQKDGMLNVAMADPVLLKLFARPMKKKLKMVSIKTLKLLFKTRQSPKLLLQF